MLSNSFKKVLPFAIVPAFVLSSCKAPLTLNSYLSKNVLWSSDDGKIEITCQGFGSERGRAILRINDEDVETTVYFSDRYDCLSFAKPTEEEGHVTEVMDLDVKSINDDNSFCLVTNFNGSGDSSYDHYSTILSKRPLKESELDARYFRNGWINEDSSLFIPSDPSDILKPNKRGTYDGETVFLWFLEKPRFELRYENGDVFASGEYKTGFDNMDLFFDEDCGKDLFGESMHMLWADAAGYALPALGN